jgi:hypothetical protein
MTLTLHCNCSNLKFLIYEKNFDLIFISVPGLYSGQEETEFNWMARHTIPPPLGTIQEGGRMGGTMKKDDVLETKGGGG